MGGLTSLDLALERNFASSGFIREIADFVIW